MGKGRFLFSLTNLFTIQRWNNRPAIIRFFEADNSFNTLLLSFLFSINNQKTGISSNIESTIERSLQWRLSRELPKIVLSDVSLQLKERIERFSPEVWIMVTKKSIEELKNIADEELIEILISPTHYESSDLNTLDKLADLYISYLEAYENNKIFNYNQPLNELREKIKHFECYFTKEEREKFWNIAEYTWPIILNLTSMVRWNRTHRNVRTSVSGHSFMVVVISYLIAKLANVKDIEEVIYKAVLHDIPEAFTGDVITPTKKKVPELDELVSTVEREMVVEWIEGNANMSNLINYINYATNPFDGNTGVIVRTADYTAALLECAIEIHSGNKIETFRENFFTFKRLIKNISLIDVSSWIDEIESEIF
ncbi:MAG: HD domain-containing protein [Fervidobacterium sp.]